MAFITLRQSNVVNSPNATIKGSPLSNSEVDNNFANLNLEISGLSNSIDSLTLTEISNGSSNVRIAYTNGPVSITGNLIPSSDNLYSLGNANFVFADLFLSGNSLHLGNLIISESNGNLALSGVEVISTSAGAVPADGSITSSKLANSSVTEDKIGTGAVTETKLGDGSVTENKIGTGAVTETKLGDGSVTENKIGTGAVTETKISANAVSSAKIANSSVTEDKIGTGAVTETKLGDDSVTTNKISPNVTLRGVVTFDSVSLEEANVISSNVTSNVTIDTTGSSIIFYTQNSRSNANVTVNFINMDSIDTNKVSSYVILLTNNAQFKATINNVQINGRTGNTVRYVGGIPSGEANIDAYAFSVVKTATSSYTVLVSKNNFS